MTRRVAIVGCRPPPGPARSGPDWDHYGRIIAAVERFVADLPANTVIVSGGANGVDTAAANAARARDLPVIEHRPDYEHYSGQRAPLERNKLIVADADELHAWPAPWSRGTWSSVRLARKAGKPVTIHTARAQ